MASDTCPGCEKVIPLTVSAVFFSGRMYHVDCYLKKKAERRDD